MSAKNTQEKGATKNVTLSQEAKFIIATSASFFARRVTSLPTKKIEFSKLTNRAQLEYLKDCAIKGVLPNINGECEISVKGLFGMDYFLKFVELVKELDVEELAKLYFDIYEKRDATSTEKRLFGLWLYSGQIVYPNIADKAAVIATEEEEAEEATEATE